MLKFWHCSKDHKQSFKTNKQNTHTHIYMCRCFVKSEGFRSLLNPGISAKAMEAAERLAACGTRRALSASRRSVYGSPWVDRICGNIAETERPGPRDVYNIVYICDDLLGLKSQLRECGCGCGLTCRVTLPDMI